MGPQGRSANPRQGWRFTGLLVMTYSQRTPRNGSENRMPPPYKSPAFPDLRPILSAANVVVELLRALSDADWKLTADPHSDGWRVQDSGDPARTYALINDAYGYWQIAEVNTAMPSRSLTAADRLRALADELDAGAA